MARRAPKAPQIEPAPKAEDAARPSGDEVGEVPITQDFRAFDAAMAELLIRHLARHGWSED